MQKILADSSAQAFSSEAPPKPLPQTQTTRRSSEDSSSAKPI